MHINELGMLNQEMTLYFVHGFAGECAWIDAFKLDRASNISIHGRASDTVKWLHGRQVEFDVCGEPATSMKYNDQAGWTHERRDYMSSDTTRSALDMGIIPNTYNDHRAYTSLASAKVYASEIAHGFIPSNKAQILYKIDEIFDEESPEEILNGLEELANFEFQPVEAPTGTIFTLLKARFADEEAAFDAPNILTIHDGGINGMCTEPVVTEEEQEPVTPPEGRIDASIPNLLIV